ncbi:MAG: NADH-quinone oxidoreductase subunit M [Thermomicrobiales bacterium]|nr:NADH-quinone oxidoreductase subunit M [Thermomicrobiales bacterium]
MDSFPILSLTAYAPLIGALLIFFVPAFQGEKAKAVALLASLVSLALSVLLLVDFEKNAEFQYVEHVEWLSGVGASYHLGIDGMALLLIALTTVISTIAIVWSWDTVQSRPREYFIALLVLETGMLGVFMALDLFVFYIFWEVMLIPMALLIGVWGSANRVYAAIKFFLYTLAGSLLMLVGIVATYQDYYQQTGVRTLNVLELQQGVYGSTFQIVVFGAFFVAFAVKVPMFPFHTWLPDAHVEAPTAASVILAAVMLKMGGYGLLRFNLPLFPDGSEKWAPYIVVLSIIAILYGAFVALVQPDMKKLVAYSSVSHMGFVTLGIFVNIAAHSVDNLHGFNGAMAVMLAHGFNTAALFLIIGVIYERAHTRQIAAFGGLARSMPIYAAFFAYFMFASIGLPGLSGFIGEFLVTLGTWEYNKLAAIITFSIVIFSAWYMMWMFQRVVLGRAKGEMPDPHDGALDAEEKAMLAAHGDGHGHGHGHGHAMPAVSGGSHDHDDHHGADGVVEYPDMTKKELWTLIPLAVLTLAVGVYPKMVFDYVAPTFERILAPFLG